MSYKYVYFLDTLGTPFGFSAVYLFGMELSCLNTPGVQIGRISWISLSIPKAHRESSLMIFQ